MKEVIKKILAKETKLKENEIENLIEIPPSDELGDFAFPTFTLAKQYKKSPVEIAQDLAKKLKKDETKEIASIESKGPYVNFFINKHFLTKEVLKKVTKKEWGTVKIDNKKIAIEYPGPNTNKALHVGHLRNIAIGESITNITKAVGNKGYHVNIYNDRGILISKSMIAYQKYAKGKTPQSEHKKGDHFVGELYQKFTKEAEQNKDLEMQAQELLKKWEAEDKETRKLWKTMNAWAYQGMQETFDTFGLSKIDKNYYESDMYKKGKEIVEKGLKNKIFYKKEDGAIAIDLEKEKLGEKILLRGDGTSIYITQDLYLAQKRVQDFKLDSSYYVVGNDQDYHFKVLFTILEKLGIKKDWQHLSYGMVALPSGKMKSRLGNVVSADELIENTQKIAKKGLTKRDAKITKKELEKRSLIIALAAIKYTLLKIDIHKKIVFDPNEALAFEGNTGPYLLYSYARASSILKKAKAKKEVKIIDLNQQEVALIKRIDNFEETIMQAYKSLAPNIIANYCFELAKSFNEFYHNSPVIGGIEEGFRVALVQAFKTTLGKALDLLGIETLEEM